MHHPVAPQLTNVKPTKSPIFYGSRFLVFSSLRLIKCSKHNQDKKAWKMRLVNWLSVIRDITFWFCRAWKYFFFSSLVFTYWSISSQLLIFINLLCVIGRISTNRRLWCYHNHGWKSLFFYGFTNVCVKMKFCYSCSSKGN